MTQLERMIDSPSAGQSPEAITEKGQDPAPDEWAALVQLFTMSRHAEFDAMADRLLERYPRSARLLHLIGASRLSSNRYAEGRDALLRAKEFAPDDPQILNLLGVAEFRLGLQQDARRRFDKSLALDPASYDTLVNASAHALATGDVDRSRHLAERALMIRPVGVEAMVGLGNALMVGGRAEEAAVVFRRATHLAPDSPVIHMNLGFVLTNLSKAEEATASLRKAVSLRPDFAAAHLNLGRALHDLGDSAEAQRHFRAASDLDPRFAEAHSAYLFSLTHDDRASPQHAFEEHIRIGDLMEAPYRGTWREHDNDRDPERDLRIGFVSGDLRDHPVANLIEPVWQAIKRGRNRIVAYSHGASGDAVALRLRSLADEWVQIERLSDQGLCDRIRADRIDILFDLAGHTASNRLPAFARRPAPIQISWIGYPGTTGLSAIDYRFVRGMASTGTELQPLFREKLVYFRSRGFRFAPDAPTVGPLPALSKGWITFASFNRPSKLSNATVALWGRVLSAIPTARLLIAGVGEAPLKEKLEKAFAALGVHSQRLDFRPRFPIREYLALHNEVDIALDTFPYAGGTTTLHALWMGVPVVTLAGDTPQQMHTAATLRTLGLTEWIAQTEDAFVSQTCRAASDLPGLGRLRAGLRQLAGQHFEDSLEKSGREMEVALRTMWRRWCARQEPTSFTVGK